MAPGAPRQDGKTRQTSAKLPLRACVHPFHAHFTRERPNIVNSADAVTIVVSYERIGL